METIVHDVMERLAHYAYHCGHHGGQVEVKSITLLVVSERS
jgi:hypothetical protein